MLKNYRRFYICHPKFCISYHEFLHKFRMLSHKLSNIWHELSHISSHILGVSRGWSWPFLLGVWGLAVLEVGEAFPLGVGGSLGLWLDLSFLEWGLALPSRGGGWPFPSRGEGWPFWECGLALPFWGGSCLFFVFPFHFNAFHCISFHFAFCGLCWISPTYTNLIKLHSTS